MITMMMQKLVSKQVHHATCWPWVNGLAAEAAPWQRSGIRTCGLL